MRALIIATILLLVLSAAGFAGDMCPCESDMSVSCGMRVSVCPKGDFETIAEGCAGDKGHIELIFRDCDGGVPGVPVTDFWMGACDPVHTFHLCAGGFVADSPTDTNGRTTFSGRIAAGGCIPSGGIYVVCQGNMIIDPYDCIHPLCLDVVIVSPDINADGQVNLSDLSFFDESYNHRLGDPEFNTCCDYNNNRWCDLSDFSFLAEHYQHQCW